MPKGIGVNGHNFVSSDADVNPAFMFSLHDEDIFGLGYKQCAIR